MWKATFNNEYEPGTSEKTPKPSQPIKIKKSFSNETSFSVVALFLIEASIDSIASIASIAFYTIKNVVHLLLGLLLLLNLILDTKANNY